MSDVNDNRFIQFFIISRRLLFRILLIIVEFFEAFEIYIALVPHQGVKPCYEADSEVHLCKEWIDGVLTTGAYFAEESLERIGLRSFALNACDIEKFILSNEFTDLHLFVQLEVSIMITQDAV